MREILFRGKNCFGEWVEGFYYQAKIYRNDSELCDYITIPHPKEEDVPSDHHIVDPETVGQYTGLIDKNGKKIFEGDILAFSDRLVRVCWHDYCGCWDCSYIKAIEGKATLHEDRGPHKWRYNAEVIGNIHDNPELLEDV